MSTGELAGRVALVTGVSRRLGIAWTVAAVHARSSHVGLGALTATLADALVDDGILANCINPGPVDTGWAPPTTHAEIAAMFPGGRWGTPVDVANLVAFLASDAGAWIVGQVIDSEGGFRRSSSPPRT